jgi:hypothetical protein
MIAARRLPRFVVLAGNLVNGSGQPQILLDHAVMQT